MPCPSKLHSNEATIHLCSELRAWSTPRTGSRRLMSEMGPPLPLVLPSPLGHSSTRHRAYAPSLRVALSAGHSRPAQCHPQAVPTPWCPLNLRQAPQLSTQRWGPDVSTCSLPALAPRAPGPPSERDRVSIPKVQCVLCVRCPPGNSPDPAIRKAPSSVVLILCCCGAAHSPPRRCHCVTTGVVSGTRQGGGQPRTLSRTHSQPHGSQH